MVQLTGEIKTVNLKNHQQIKKGSLHQLMG